MRASEVERGRNSTAVLPAANLPLGLKWFQVATWVGDTCRRPAPACDFEHNTPYASGGRTCLCNGGPKCRHDHRLKQQPGWTVDQLPDGTFRWTTPAGRSYDTEPTRYPI